MGGEDLPVPWKRTDVFEERVRFVVAASEGSAPVSELCRAAGISRESGYKWLRRYREGGVEALRDASRAPRSRPWAIPEAVGRAVVALRRERPGWGARKLRAKLMERHPEVAWPVASSLGALLCREGLVASRGRQRRAEPRERPFAAAQAPNDEWAIDFKGWFRTADGQRCDPLTVSDTASRYLLECRIMRQRLTNVRDACEVLFRAHGLPGRMRCDNGTPFGSRGPAGLTKLSVWWVKLGIEVLLIHEASPQENGRHERLHGTLQREVGGRARADAAALQAAFDRFRRDYNEERPHEALGQIPPGRLWRASDRAYPERVEEPWYDARHEVRRVNRHGQIKWQGEEIAIGEALVGEPVGLAELASGDWLVRFAGVELGVIERRGLRFWRYGPARPGRAVAPDTTENKTRNLSAMSPV